MNTILGPGLSSLGYNNDFTMGLFDPHKPQTYDEKYTYVGGLDCGKQRNHSAVAVIRRSVYGRGFIGPTDNRWQLRMCQAIKLHTDYHDVARFVLSLPLSILCFDATGGGIVVFDILKRMAMEVGFKGRIKACTLVGSRMEKSLTREKGYISVPKREMVTAIEAAIQSKRIVPSIEHVDDWQRLVAQASTFERIQTQSGAVRYQASGKEHGVQDDLITAFGLPAWWTAHYSGREAAILM